MSSRRPFVVWAAVTACSSHSSSMKRPAALSYNRLFVSGFVSTRRSIREATCCSRQPPLSTSRKRSISSAQSRHSRWFATTSASSDADDDNEKCGNADENRQIEATTRAWLENVVIGMNLCPFAERPLRQQKLKIDVIRGNDQEEILGLILAEMLLRIEEPGTTLLVCPACFPNDFEAYLDIINMIENGLMKDHKELVGAVQVAPFHPLFQFEGSGIEGVDNWTNRSPYPTFHILREEEVTRAVDQLGGDAGKVWKRNVNLLHAMEEELGRETFEKVVRGQDVDEDSQGKVKAILKRFRIQLGK